MPAFIDKIFSHEFFCPMLTHYIEPLVPFTAWAKIYSSEYFCSTKVAELGEIFFSSETVLMYGN